MADCYGRKKDEEEEEKALSGRRKRQDVWFKTFKRKLPASRSDLSLSLHKVEYNTARRSLDGSPVPPYLPARLTLKMTHSGMQTGQG